MAPQPEASSSASTDRTDSVRPLAKAAGVRILWLLAAVSVGVALVISFQRFQIEGHGFTYVLDFGNDLGLPRLPEVDQLPVYIHPQVAGYDGQMYAQLALRPLAAGAELSAVLDNPPYRARRILMPWVSFILGLGNPWWILNVQALLNLATWIALGVLMLRWFPPTGMNSFVRWAGVMLSAGLLSSLRHALTDGPALLAIAGCVALLECGHRRMAVLVGAMAGLTRETAVLAAAVFAPAALRDFRGWVRATGIVALMVAPLALWMGLVMNLSSAGTYHGAGFANFTWPFAGFLERWEFLIDLIAQRGWQTVIGFSFLLHLAITIQVIVIVARPRWQDPWWRIGAVHVVLLAMLNTQVWEDFPGAAPRVLLPLTLAFNVLVPRGWRWSVVLVAGNLAVGAGLLELRPPPREIVSIVSTADPAVESAVAVELGEGFLVLEGSGERSWRWTSGDARASLKNNTGRAIHATLSATVRSRSERVMFVRADGMDIGQIAIGNERTQFRSSRISLPPHGAVTLDFLSGDPDPVRLGETRSLAIEISAISIAIE